MKNKVIIGGVIGIVALAISNGIALNKISTLEENTVTKEDIAALQDSIIAFESNDDLTDKAFTKAAMDNPLAIVRSLAKYRFEQEQIAKEKEAKELSNYTDMLYGDKSDPIMGNPNGKHVVVEFIDYNCGYCKRLAPILHDFIQRDPEAKVIVKEYPIFTNQPTSAYSALMGTALYYYDREKYVNYHNTVIAQKRITKESVDSALMSLGVSKAQLQPHLAQARKQIEKTRALGARLKVTGTPTVFVGSERMHGGFTTAELMTMFN